MNKKTALPLRFVALGDQHWGRDIDPMNPQAGLVDLQDKKCNSLVLDFIKDYKPHLIALMGDQVNCAGVSRWVKGKPRQQEGQRLKRDAERYDKEFLQKLEALAPRKDKRQIPLRDLHRHARNGYCRFVWLDGNHEAWADQFVDQAPGVEGLIEPREILELQDRGFTVLPQGAVLKIGKWHGTHGDVMLRGRFVSKYPTNSALQSYVRSIRLWHTHTKQVLTQNVLADEGYNTAVCVPCLCRRGPSYLRNAPTRYVNGFMSGIVWPDGYFDDYIHTIWKNRFWFNGRTYRR